MPRTALTTFTSMTSDGRTLTFGTDNTEAMVPIDKVDYATMDATSNSPTITVHSREASATIVYGSVDELAADWGELLELLSRPEDTALRAQVDQNTADIAANQASIVNLNNDLAGMFARLTDLEAHVTVLTANVNNLGERVTALEAQP